MLYYFIFKDDKESTIGYVDGKEIENINSNDFEDEFNNIYIAKIISEIESIDGYIIEIEKNKKACIEKNKVTKDVKLGDEIIVQLYKKTEEGKFDKYTMNYAIAGKNLVYYPLRKENKFSYKINRNKLVEFKKKLEKADIFEGLTFRTSSIDVKIENIIQEYSSLIKINDYIKKQSKFLPIPRKIYSNSKYIFELINRKFDYIVTNNNEVYNILNYYFSDKNIIFNEEYDYKYDMNISEDLENLGSSKINILDNSNIIIEKTQALTVVDVNSGNDSNFFVINIEAIKETLRQIELRRIQGIILVDIINLKRNELEALIQNTKNYIKKYPRISYMGISNTGLMEFVRTGINIDI